jgi:transcriptional repressor NrdR
MHCPYCRSTDTRVLDSRVAEDGGAIRRRRTCPSCEKRFTTVEQMQLTVLKRSGASEPFTRDKAISGVRKACKGRPVTEDQLACLGQEVEDALRLDGAAEVPAFEVGKAILGPLRELDEVAYLRFASVYRSFESADDFEDEIALLRANNKPDPTVVEVRAPASLETTEKELAASAPSG